MTLTAEIVREHLAYDPETGIFTRLVSSGYRGCHKAGKAVGSSNGGKYLETMLLGHRVLLHRLAYLYMTGEWPTDDVDHIDGDGRNNRWNNLREVTRKTNIQNQRKAQSSNKSGFLGASFDKFTGRYVARINSNGKYLNLGRFDTAEEAHAAYLEAKRRLHKGNTI